MSTKSHMQRGKRGAKNRRNNSNRKMVIPHPPAINGLELRHSPTLRFRATAAFPNQLITFQNLLDLMLVATTAVAGSDLFQAVRIRRVQLWGIAAVGAASSVSLEFAGVTAGVVGDQCIHTDTSMGIEPAYVSAAPSSRSLASDFQLSTAAAAFVMSGPAGTVIDVDLSYRGPTFSTVSAAAANALVGATAGSQYVRGLDGLATAASNFVPEFTLGQI